jgi:transcriptional regulator with XRE-family HTH domain
MSASEAGEAAVELRRLRQQTGLSLSAAAALAGVDKSTLSRLETGKAAIDANHVALMAEALQLSPVALLRLNRLLGDRQPPATVWWTRYAPVLSAQYEELIYLESKAVGIETASTLVPGLMQAEGYARASIMRSAFVPDPDDGEALLQVRLHRQQIITEGRVTLSATLSEAALWQSFCGRVALQQQLRHLLDLAELDNVRLHIVPFDAQAVPFLGAMTLLRFAPPMAAVAHLEYEAGSQLIKDDRPIKRYGRNLEYNRDAAATEAESRQMIVNRLDNC